MPTASWPAAVSRHAPIPPSPSARRSVPRMQLLGMTGGRFQAEVAPLESTEPAAAWPRPGRVPGHRQSRATAAGAGQGRLRRRTGTAVAGRAGGLHGRRPALHGVRRSRRRHRWRSRRDRRQAAARTGLRAARCCASPICRRWRRRDIITCAWSSSPMDAAPARRSRNSPARNACRKSPACWVAPRSRDKALAHAREMLASPEEERRHRAHAAQLDRSGSDRLRPGGACASQRRRATGNRSCGSARTGSSNDRGSRSPAALATAFWRSSMPASMNSSTLPQSRHTMWSWWSPRFSSNTAMPFSKWWRVTRPAASNCVSTRYTVARPMSSLELNSAR